MNTLDRKLLKDFKKDKEYAHAYMEEVLNAHIATQIKVLREQMVGTQEKLAKEAGMQQARISVLENVNYSSWSINTLRKLARAFDLVLWVSFENFSVGLRNFESLCKESLQRTPRVKDLSVYQCDDEPALQVPPPPPTATQTQVAILSGAVNLREYLSGEGGCHYAAASTVPGQKPDFTFEIQEQQLQTQGTI